MNCLYKSPSNPCLKTADLDVTPVLVFLISDSKHSRPLFFVETMVAKSLFLNLLTLAVAVTALPQKRATCSKGRSASNEAVCVQVVLSNLW